MKITNYNIHYWLFGLANVIYVIFFSISNKEISDPLIIYTGVLGVIWLFYIIDILIKMSTGEIRFEFELIPGFSNWKEKRTFQRAKREKISELKKLAIEKIDNQKEFEKIIEKIAKLEDEKFEL